MPRLLPRLLAALALIAAATACGQDHSGAVKVVVIGAKAPRMTDPAAGPLAPADSVLLENAAQGLVRMDSRGEIVPGLAERWNVSDDGLSYIFRLANTEWPDGRRVTARQVARLLKRSLAPRSRNPLKDALGAVEDVVAMTERVIEIRLRAPRPNLLQLLAQPEFALVRDGLGTGPFTIAEERGDAGEIILERTSLDVREEREHRQEVWLGAAPAAEAIASFASGKSELVLGGTFADLPLAHRLRLGRQALQFHPVGGLFGLVPARASAPLSDVEVRRLLSQAIDRDALVAALAVPGLSPRATVLEPGLEGTPPPTVPGWSLVPIAERLASLRSEAERIFGSGERPALRIALPEGPGADLLLQRLAADWSALGVQVERAGPGKPADLRLIDLVAPSTSPAWYLRQFRCGAAPICNEEVDGLLDAARQAPVPAQRAALLGEAALRIEDAQLFIPLAAPIRWMLVSQRLRGFTGNRFARSALTDLH